MNFFSLFKRNFLYKFKKKINIDEDNIEKKNLDQLFEYYKSDKSNKKHGFSELYTQNLIELRNKKTNILEVGSYAGSSAAAFVKYFPKSSIYCFDINISKFIYSSKNIHVFGLDINNIKKVENVIKEIKRKGNFENFDLIIDDGSHYLSDILFTLKFLFKHLSSKGHYVIEDFMHPNYYEYNKDIDHIFIDRVLKNLQQKKIFQSQILDKEDQIYLHKNINTIEISKGNLKDSDICFINKI